MGHRICVTHEDGTVVETDTRTLDEARAEAVERVMAQFEQQMRKPWLDGPTNKPLDIDEASIARMAAAATAAAQGLLPPNFRWRCADNSFLPLTASEMTAMAARVMGYVYMLRTLMWAAKDAAMNAPTKEAADAVHMG